MSSVLFESPAGRVPSWRVEYFVDDDPRLIRFIKRGKTRKLLDQIGRWHGNRWDPARWCPDGKVPKDVMRQVVCELLRREVVG